MATKVKLIADGVITPDQITLTTASSGTNTTAPATTAFVQQEISALVDSSPDALNTLNELAAALGDDANFSTTVTNSIATKLPLAGGTLTGNLLIGTTDAGYPAYGDELTIGSASGNNGMTIRSGTSNYGTFYFSDATGNGAGTYAGKLQYNHSNDSMVLATNSVDRLTIDNNGQVMIGHTSSFAHADADNLAIGDGTNNSGLTIYTGASKESSIIFGNAGTNGNIEAGIKYYHESHGTVANRRAMTFATGGSMAERMRIDASGNVGIGNSTPSNNHANANRLVVGNGTAGGIANYVGTGLGWYAFSRDNANNTDAYDGGMAYDGSRNLTFHTNAGAERLRIDGTGNVGIGTSSPSQILHVKAASPNILLEGTSFPSLKWAGTDLTADAEIYYGVGGLDWNFNNYNNGRIVFKTNSTERMRIKEDGQITTQGDILPGADIIMANGRGISFAASSNAGGMTSELLDDYEEGTWTPTFSGATLSTATGFYTKIGDQVTVHYHIVTTGGLPGSQSQVRINDLPFSSAGNNVGAGSQYVAPYNVSNSSLGSIVQSSNDYIRFININTGSYDYLLMGELEVTANNSIALIGTFTYRT